ncbi:hypothetical protein CF327_g5225 [Tilletia walkeri]|uniref:3-methyl-2-oxobutanoate hydroxymethyltransferase n=1 Tax=Tilletia walkeri TaxID=117179 RepID=A0A8X7N5X7_9BASI|nr:hypothetical protein CF327_g5225 [Tilletia walkeri]KAE8267757.1 hypothetical protein A4X09_0g4595 [Tilletia walkeri]
MASSSSRLTTVGARAVSAALRTDTATTFSRYHSFSTSSSSRSSWPVGSSDDADEPSSSRHYAQSSATRSMSASGSSSSSSAGVTAAATAAAHRTRAGPILERSPPVVSSHTHTSEDDASHQPGAENLASSSSNAVGLDSARSSNSSSASGGAALSASEAVLGGPRKVGREEGAEKVKRATNVAGGASTSEKQQRSSSSSSSNATRRLPPAPRQKTIMYLDKMKEAGTPIAALTAYDYPTALALRAADTDICLVGDSLANVALGFATTQGLRLDALIHHAQAVQRALRASTLLATAPPIPLVVADMPFGTFQTSIEEGVRAAVRLIQEGGVDGVKIEGGAEVVPLVQRLTSFGIPVMGHVGLQPQRVGATSGYRVQGRSAGAAWGIWESARAIQDAGAFAIVLECVPSAVAQVLTRRLDIPTIGIGAGPDCDGQILVTSDMLGELTSPAHVVAGLEGDHEDEGVLGVVVEGGRSTRPVGAAGIVPAAAAPAEEDVPPPPSPSSEDTNHHDEQDALPRPHPSTPTPPKFVRQFTRAGTTLGAIRMQAVRDYVVAVRERRFPAEGVETYGMKEEQFRGFLEAVEREEEREQRE